VNLDEVYGLGKVVAEPKAYPWSSIKVTSAHPKGAEKAIHKVVNKALASVGSIIQAGASYLGIVPQQICPAFEPHSLTPNAKEQAYIANVGGSLMDAQFPTSGEGGVGMGDAAQAAIIQTAQQQAIKTTAQVAAKTAATSLGATVPVAGVAVAAAGVLTDPKGSFATSGATIGTTATVASTSLIAAGSIAACLPVIGWAVAAGLCIKAAFDFSKGKKAAKKEKQRWKKLAKAMKSVAKILQKEAQGLVNNLVSRGVPIGKPSPAVGAALHKHYAMQLSNYTGRTKFSRMEQLGFLLQAARDIRILNGVIATHPAGIDPGLIQQLVAETVKTQGTLVSAATKTAFVETTEPAELKAYEGGTADDIQE